MERLSFTSTVRYNATEAAIHMARYQLAAPYCKGKRVLDVACGEGYGSYALRQIGAASVDGVDNSQQAIANAESLFAKPGITFHLHEAETIDELFPQARFDVIVCLETIEHLNDPERFLHAIKKIAADGAAIVVTCPNDHWYYPTDDQSNPFHAKKYSFEAFRKVTTGVLGNASAWGYGGPVVGFGAVTDELVAGDDPLVGQTMMLDFRAQASAITLPPRGFSSIGPRNCSYFVGVWGGDAKRIYTSAVVPISMDHYANLVSWETAQLSPRRLSELEKERSALLADKLQLERRVAQAQTQAAQFKTRSEASEREVEQAGATLEQVQRDAATTLERTQRDFATKLHAVERERQRYRIQSFALVREFDLISIQLGKMAAERDSYLAELGAAREAIVRLSSEQTQWLAEREQLLAELGAAQEAIISLSSEQTQWLAEREQLLAERERLSAVQQHQSAERERLLAEREQLLHELKLFSAEREQLLADQQHRSAEREQLLAQQQQLLSRLSEQDGLRYLTKTAVRMLGRRLVALLRLSVVTPARTMKPYLPAPILSLARRIARTLRL